MEEAQGFGEGRERTRAAPPRDRGDRGMAAWRVCAHLHLVFLGARGCSGGGGGGWRSLGGGLLGLGCRGLRLCSEPEHGGHSCGSQGPGCGAAERGAHVAGRMLRGRGGCCPQDACCGSMRACWCMGCHCCRGHPGQRSVDGTGTRRHDRPPVCCGLFAGDLSAAGRASLGVGSFATTREQEARTSKVCRASDRSIRRRSALAERGAARL